MEKRRSSGLQKELCLMSWKPVVEIKALLKDHWDMLKGHRSWFQKDNSNGSSFTNKQSIHEFITILKKTRKWSEGEESSLHRMPVKNCRRCDRVKTLLFATMVVITGFQRMQKPPGMNLLRNRIFI